MKSMGETQEEYYRGVRMVPYDLVKELVDRGYPAATPAERRRLEMVADIHIAATEVLALGYISERYPDIDEVVDMLVLVTRGTRLTRAWRSSPQGSKSVAATRGTQ